MQFYQLPPRSVNAALPNAFPAWLPTEIRLQASLQCDTTWSHGTIRGGASGHPQAASPPCLTKHPNQAALPSQSPLGQFSVDFWRVGGMKAEGGRHIDWLLSASP